MKLPSCQLGYTTDDLTELLGPDLESFSQWMSGQTIGICDGREYDHDAKEFRETGCGPHGAVCYRRDVEGYLRRGSGRGC